MARHVFVLLFVAVCLLQVVMTLAREDWDTDESPEARGKVLEGLKDAASKLSHKVGNSLRDLQEKVTDLAKRVGAAFGREATDVLD